MIPSHDQYVARFRHDQPGGRPWHSTRPVLAWDDEGEALVADENAGRLVRASSLPRFAGLEEARGPIVAAIPANGWVAIFREEDGALTPDPIVGWAVDRSGAVHPIGMGRNGSVEYPTDIGNFVQLLAPGEQLEDVDDE
ncbi:hypothetical protein [Streptomyces sp. NPDC049744]|uniref:hypothetical protein n=1 Tax=Streptomyces sp. NPDC049744 TaxID=3154359 RepID=UPI003415BC99